MGCLYRITHIDSGKSYIGMTSRTANERFKDHVCSSQDRYSGRMAIISAIRKYGPEAFIVKTLVIANDWDYLSNLEIKAIEAFSTIAPNGYNLKVGGHTWTGGKRSTKPIRKKHSIETIAKLSRAAKLRPKRKLSDEHKIKIGLAHKNRMLPELQRLKISASWDYRREFKNERRGFI